MYTPVLKHEATYARTFYLYVYIDRIVRKEGVPKIFCQSKVKEAKSMSGKYICTKIFEFDFIFPFRESKFAPLL
jgi:hypothetical protein